MKTPLILASFGMLVFQSLSFAQSHSGNGGRAFVCFNAQNRNEVIAAQVTDLEENSLSKWTLDLGEESILDDESAFRVALEASKRIEKYDPILSGALSSVIKRIKNEAHYLRWEDQGQTLGKIMDAQTQVMPIQNNCVELQAAFNKPNHEPMEYGFVFVKNITDKMNNRHYAALIFHEALYYLEALNGANNSDGLRKVVRAVFSKEFQSLSLRDWSQLGGRNLKRKLNFQQNGLIFQSVTDWLSDGRIAQGLLRPDQVLPFVYIEGVSKPVKPKSTWKSTLYINNIADGKMFTEYRFNESGEEGAISEVKFQSESLASSCVLTLKSADVVGCKDIPVRGGNLPVMHLFHYPSLEPIQTDHWLNDEVLKELNLKEKSIVAQSLHRPLETVSMRVRIEYKDSKPRRAIIYASRSMWDNDFGFNLFGKSKDKIQISVQLDSGIQTVQLNYLKEALSLTWGETPSLEVIRF